MKIGTLTSDRLTLLLEITIIFVSCSIMFVESVALYPRAKKYYNYILKNHVRSSNEDTNDRREYDGALTYRDFLENNYANDNEKYKDMTMKNRASSAKKNHVTRSFGGSTAGLTRILTFPLKNPDNKLIGEINDFAPGDPAADCLSGGVDAGVVNGALRIGIGVGLAPGCGTSTEQAPKMVPVPVLVPRPFPVPVGVPQPYPIAIDVPRPVAIRVPQPIPFPAYNMGPMSVMASMQRFPSQEGRPCLFQNCVVSSGSVRPEGGMNVKKRMNRKRHDYMNKMRVPEVRIFRSFQTLSNRTNQRDRQM